MKTIALIATGGTIAGEGSSRLATSDYKAGALPIDALLTSVPLPSGVVLRPRQLYSIDSADLDEEHLLRLARAAQEEADRPDTDGIVIIHGTDTMEESAYFLHLTVHTRKPIVFTGAMRPATALSADGPLNLANAVSLAAAPEAAGMGVLTALNDRIASARFAEKTHATNTDTFRGREEGFLGLMDHGRPVFYQKPIRVHTEKSMFSVPSKEETLPAVRILWCYAGMDGRMISEAAKDGVKGLVLAGVGYGNIPSYVQKEIQNALDSGLWIVRASRTLSGRVNRHDGDEARIIAGDNLTPQKAKILLQLCLLHSLSPKETQSVFFSY
jgi:L-asparaginase